MVAVLRIRTFSSCSGSPDAIDMTIRFSAVSPAGGMDMVKVTAIETTKPARSWHPTEGVLVPTTNGNPIAKAAVAGLFDVGTVQEESTR